MSAHGACEGAFIDPRVREPHADGTHLAVSRAQSGHDAGIQAAGEQQADGYIGN